MDNRGEVLSFRIDRWTPDSIPMARLAEYMVRVAELYGEASSVHFTGIKKGSAIIQSRVEVEAVPKVIARLQIVNTSDAPEPLAKTYHAIDEMLRSDNASATIVRPKVGRVVDFPGRKMAPPDPIVISQPSTVDGVVVRIGGYDETIPMLLQDAEGETYHCTVKGRPQARELAKFLFGSPIRVHGLGRWERSAQGKWTLLGLTVTDHEELDGATLDQAVAAIRAAAAEAWPDDAMERWKRERDGG